MELIVQLVSPSKLPLLMLCSWFSPQDCVQTGRPGTRQNMWRMPLRPCSWLTTGWASRRSVCVVTYTWCLLLPAGLITLAFNTLTRRSLLLRTNGGSIYSAVIFTAEVKGRWQHLTQTLFVFLIVGSRGSPEFSFLRTICFEADVAVSVYKLRHRNLPSWLM